MSIRLGLFYPNARSLHVASAKVAAANASVLEFETHRQVAQAAEEIGLDYLFLADSWGSNGPRSREVGMMDPIVLAPMLALLLFSSTERIRCITTFHTSWFHPLIIARMGGVLDCMSKGRWGINLVSGGGKNDSMVADISGAMDHNQRYERAAEVVEILQQAWADGVVDFAGKHFRIQGQIVGPRPVQERPIVVSAGASDAGRNFAGSYADCIFMPGRTPPAELFHRIGDIRRAAEEHGRASDSIKLQMHASVVVRESAGEAKEMSDWIASNIDHDITAEYMQAIQGLSTTYADIYRALGDTDFRQIGSVSGARKVHGSADEVADQLEMLHRELGCDGIAITFPIWSPEEIRTFGKLVLPRLHAKGIWSPPAERDWSW